MSSPLYTLRLFAPKVVRTHPPISFECFSKSGLSSLACQHSLPHHTHSALGPCVLVMDRSLSTSVGLFTSLGCTCIPALGNGYQTTEKNPNNPRPPEPKRSSAEQEAFSRCECECLKLFGLFLFYRTMHPQVFHWDLLLQVSKINSYHNSSCSVKEIVNLHDEASAEKSFQHLGLLPQGMKK